MTDFSLPVNAEQRYTAQLNRIANNCQMIIDSYPQDPAKAAQKLIEYASIMEEWSRLCAYEMLMDCVRNRDRAFKDINPKKPSKNEELIRARKEKRRGITSDKHNRYGA